MSASVLYDAPGPKARRRSRVISAVSTAVIVILVGWFIFTLGQPRVTAGGATLPGIWDPSRWDIFTDPAVWNALLWRGLVMGTLRAAGLAAVLALILGVILALGRMSRNAFIRVPVMVILEFFRGMPVLLMMLFILLGLKVGDYWAVVWALAIYNGAIIGEALRSGVVSLPRGQSEAAFSLGFTGMQTRFLIELPQAFRQMLPIIVAQLVVLLKDTSLAYIVAYPELLRVSYSLKDFYGSGTYSFSFFFVTLVIYLLVNLSLSALARRLAHQRGKGTGGRKQKKRGGAGPMGPETALLSVGGAPRIPGQT